jgi:mannonate dehydratase
MLEVMRAYREIGFEGTLVVDHPPHIVGDTDWGHRSIAFAVGYMRSLVEAVMHS